LSAGYARSALLPLLDFTFGDRAEIPLFNVEPLENTLAAQTASARFGSLLLGSFALLAGAAAGLFSSAMLNVWCVTVGHASGGIH
jgi:hypothetical protein